MKSATHKNFLLPNHYGYFYPVHNLMCIYVAEFIKKIRIAISGMLFVPNEFRCKEQERVQTTFKMGGFNFFNRLNLRQTVKYGACVYLMAAMVSIPSGICSSQYLTANVRPIEQTIQLPSLITLLKKSAASQAQRDYAEAELKAILAKLSPVLPPFHNHVLKASKTYGVDVALIRAIIMVESSNNPKAVSYRGAQGLMQLMPRTAKWLGVQDSFNPALNIDGGVRYFRRLLDRFDNDVELALAAYNAGSRYVRQYKGVPPFKDTQIYIKKVLKYRQDFEKLLAADHFDTLSS